MTYKYAGSSYRHKRVPLNLEEAGRLRKEVEKDYYDEKDRLIVNVLLDTGLRVEEFQGLVRSQLLLKENVIEIRDTRFEEGSRGKGDWHRRVPMSKKVRELLEKWFKKHDSIEMSTRTIQRRLKLLGESAGISKKVCPHVLRHTFAVTYIHKGGNVGALMKLMGHKNISTTMIYLNYLSELARDLAVDFDIRSVS